MSYRKNFRLQSYPQALASCYAEASAYALCVSGKEDLKQNDCNSEFQLLKSCFHKNLKKIVSKQT